MRKLYLKPSEWQRAQLMGREIRRIIDQLSLGPKPDSDLNIQILSLDFERFVHPVSNYSVYWLPKPDTDVFVIQANWFEISLIGSEQDPEEVCRVPHPMTDHDIDHAVICIQNFDDVWTVMRS